MDKTQMVLLLNKTRITLLTIALVAGTLTVLEALYVYADSQWIAAHTLAHARRDSTWLLVTIGILLPGLWRIARELHRAKLKKAV